jgi:hypothetical protein
MALLFCDGFDSYTKVADLNSRGWVGGVGNIAPNSYVGVNTSAGPYGGTSVTFGPTDFNSAIQMPNIFTFADGITLNFAMLFRQVGLPSTNYTSSSGNSSGLISMGYDAATAGNCDSYPLLFPTMSGKLQACGWGMSCLPAAVGKINVCDGVWHWIEAQFVLTKAATGSMTVYIDGLLDIQVTGVQTRFTIFTPFGHVGFGAGANNGGWNCTSYYDDFIVWDNTGSSFNTFPIGQKRIYSGDPTGAGDSSQFTPSTGSNYAAASQAWSDATVGTNSLTALAASETDLYLANVLKGATPSEIDAVLVNAYANNPGAGARSLINVLKSKGVVVPGRTNQLLSTLKTYQQVFYQDSGSSAWTPTTVNSMQIGVESA